MEDITFIEYNSQGFWIPSGFIEVLSDYICEIFENIGKDTFSQGLKKIYIYCDLNRRGGNVGMVDILFDNAITNEIDKNELINVLAQTKILISSKGTELSIESLDAFEDRKVNNVFKVDWGYPIKTSSLLATIDIIIKMLNGTWNREDYAVYYAGFPNPTNMPEI